MTTGFFIKKTTAVPILRIQDVTLSAGPLLQFKKLQSVKIHTAAAVHEIGGVDRQTATKLKTKIMDLAKEEDVYES
jgi:membrane protein YdbS with pleckstrin-like domain